LNILEIQELIKSARRENNISYEYLSLKLKTTKSAIEKVENDPDFVEKNKPYSLYLLKSICRELNIEINENIKTNDNTSNKEDMQDKSYKENSFVNNLKLKFFNILRLSFLFFILFPIFAYIYYLNNIHYSISKDTENLSFAYEIPKIEDTVSKTTLNNTEADGEKHIKILSNKNAWISANIDGQDKVFNLSKNNEINIQFQDKIHFITIGNANNVTIYYKGKKVTFKKEKIIHNLFIDQNGIFKDGYNLIGKNS
jgi:cytoskeletal protein RodZ